MLIVPTVRFVYGPFEDSRCDYCGAPLDGEGRYRLASPGEQLRRSLAAPPLVQVCGACHGGGRA